MQSKQTIGQRIQFVVQTYKELKKYQQENILNKKIQQFVNNMQKFLTNQEEDIETN